MSPLSFRRLLGPFALLVATFFLGTIGYWLVGVYGAGRGEIPAAWSLADCAFMTAITLTTVGYEDWRGILSYPLARFYTVGLLFAGMGVVLYAISEVTSFVVEGHLAHLMERRRLMKTLERLSGHILVCGVGETGSSVAAEFAKGGKTFVGIERDAARAEKLKDRSPEILLLHGDATDEDILRRAGIERAEGLVACLSDDKENLFLTITARSMNPNLRIVARADGARVAGKLATAGADRVVTPTATGGVRMAAEMTRPHVVTFLDTILAEAGNHRFGEVEVAAGSPLAGLAMKNARIREKTGMNVIAIRDPKGDYHYNVQGEEVLGAGEVLIAVGTAEMLDSLRRLAGRTG